MQFPIREIGIIPALAGNTSHKSLIVSHAWDHPRACGEHDDGVDDSIEALGSSPRLRGTPFFSRVLA